MSKKEQFRVCIIVKEGNPHAACFTEVALLLKNTFLSMGKNCDVKINELHNDRINIILGANLLNPETFSTPSRYIIYQLEQLSEDEGWYSDSKLDIFHRAYTVWDYSPQNIAFLKKHNVNAQYLPIGYHPTLEQIKSDESRDIDIMFFGSRNERRNKILQSLHDKGLNVKALFGIYGKERDALIARSKIILNIHFYSVNIFEAVRVSYLLNNRCFVLSEDSPVYPYDGIDLCQAPYEKIIDTCCYYLEHPDEMEERRNLVYNQFKELYPMEKLLKEVLQ